MGCGRRGLKHALAERKEVIALADEAVRSGCRQSQVCAALGVNERTLQRWRFSGEHGDRRQGPLSTPSHKLTEQEREKIVSIASCTTYCNMTPWQIVPKLADEGDYIASEASFYRVLRENNLSTHRGSAKPKTHKKPTEHSATGPNELWSWDITYLSSQVRGKFFFLYLILDIFSRKIVGFSVHENESSELASNLITTACENECVDENEVTLHSDNGSPMKGATMLATLQRLGVIPSFSRPSVSNDNPYSESMFKTLKYCPQYPGKPFASIEEAHHWVEEFVHWYNTSHLHSGIKYVTPTTRHGGDDKAILSKRAEVYEKARIANPNRWSRNTRNWQPITEVFLNPKKSNNNITQHLKSA